MSILDRSLRDFLDEVAAPAPTATGGTVAAVTASAAAGLCAMVAGLDTGAGADELAKRAEAARREASELADADGRSYASVLRATRMPKNAPGRTEALRAALCEAAQPPLRLCRVCADIASLAAELTGRCKRSLRGDTVTAAALAASAAHGAAELVSINLAAAGDSESMVNQAREWATEADRHAGRTAEDR